MASGSGAVPVGKTPGAARPRCGTRRWVRAQVAPRPAVAEYRQAPSLLALFSYGCGQAAGGIASCSALLLRQSRLP